MNGIGSRRRVLFIGEAVTLAHVTRPAVLAQALDPERYEITFACDSRYNDLLPNLPGQRRTISSIPSQQFLDAISQGKPLYDVQTLRAYVKDDLALMEAVQPDLVVGDFRLSLAVSARIAKVPYITITNVYWSPYARQRFPMPDLSLSRYLGLPIARMLYHAVRPLAFAFHTIPMNRVCRECGLRPLGTDLRRVYTDADCVLYADVPALAPALDLRPNHQFIGPVFWSPEIAPPPWWDHLPEGRPVIYVTLGSSGRSDLLPVVLEGLAGLPVSVMAATAQRIDPKDAPQNAFMADYLPGDKAARRADLVISNGGSPTTYQALAEGKPVLGIATNLDQHLMMQDVKRAGVGEVMRAGTTAAPAVQRLVDRMLREPTYREGAKAIAADIAKRHAPTHFRAHVDGMLCNRTTTHAAEAVQSLNP